MQSLLFENKFNYVAGSPGVYIQFSPSCPFPNVCICYNGYVPLFSTTASQRYMAYPHYWL